MTYAQIWLLIDGANRNLQNENRARSETDKKSENKLPDDIPPCPDKVSNPVEALRWELTYWPIISAGKLPIAVPQLSPEQINEACLKLEQKLKAEAESKEQGINTDGV